MKPVALDCWQFAATEDAFRRTPCTGFHITFTTRFLQAFVFAAVCTYAAFGGTYFVITSYLMSQMNWTQANASLALFAQSMATIVGYFINYNIVGVIPGQAYACFGLGLLLCAIGNVVVGVASPLLGVTGFWVGFMLIGLSYGLSLPALPTIVSQYAAPEQQAQLQAVFTIASMLGMIVGSELQTNLYSETAEGVLAGLPFYASAGLLLIALFLHSLVRQLMFVFFLFFFCFIFIFLLLTCTFGLVCCALIGLPILSIQSLPTTLDTPTTQPAVNSHVTAHRDSLIVVQCHHHSYQLNTAPHTHLYNISIVRIYVEKTLLFTVE